MNRLQNVAELRLMSTLDEYILPKIYPIDCDDAPKCTNLSLNDVSTQPS